MRKGHKALLASTRIRAKQTIDLSCRGRDPGAGPQSYPVHALFPGVFLRQRCGHKRGRHQQLSCAPSISHQARSYRRLPKRAIGFILALRVHRQDEYPKSLQVHLVPIDDAKLQQSVQVQTLPRAPPRCTLLHAHVLRCSKPSVGSKPLPPGTYSAGSSPHERTQQRDY
jgi:hypothetical protein